MKRTTAGVFLARLLVATLAGAAVWAFWLTYSTMRNSGGGFWALCDAAATFVLAVLCCLGGLLLVLFVRLLGGRRREPRVALLCWMLMVGGFLAGGLVGQWKWGREFERNRQRAEGVIARLEAFRSTNGEYPVWVEEAGVDTPVTVHRGDHTDELEYHRYSPTQFVLCYNYGWYDYIYDSKNGRWEAHD
jgi:hypothetical protein